MTDLHPIAWDTSRLSEAMELLAHKSGLLRRAIEVPTCPEQLGAATPELLRQWVEVSSARLGIEAEPIHVAYAEIEALVRQGGPALLHLPNSMQVCAPRFLALLKSEWSRAVLLGSDGHTHRVPLRTVREALSAELEAPLRGHTDQLLAEVGVPAARRARAQRALLDEWLGATQLAGSWLLRMSPGANFAHQVRQAGLVQPFLLIVGVHTIQQVLSLIAWALIGRGALDGRLEPAWLVAWLVILLTAIPFQSLLTWVESRFAFGLGGLFKQRMLLGTLQLEPEEIRHQGAGQFLGRVMDSEAVELLAVGGGLGALLALIQLVIAASILAAGAGGWPHALLLLACAALATLIGWRYFHDGQAWLDTYRALTNDLVEAMVGHRTRLAQQDPARWHDEEDQALARYLKLTEQLDRLALQVNALAPRGWLILGLLGIAYAFVMSADWRTQLAISLGGIILASQALTSLVGGILSLVAAMLAWKQVGPLFQAAARPRADESLTLALQNLSPATRTIQPARADGQSKSAHRRLSDRASAAASNAPVELERPPLLLARDLNFRYGGRAQAALRDCNLVIRPGDRLLLEGPSGGGKSTLAAVLAGLRAPESGLLLLWGFDRQTVGTAEWRRRVVAAPQFHENHVFTETFGFNLLMGRGYPPSPEDWQEAQAICQELGLDELVARMPAGFQQMVGESGWRLSHGEQSRLFIARALLQKADLIILDESFAALDPENLQRALECVLKRARTLLVIAHP